LFLHLRND